MLSGAYTLLMTPFKKDLSLDEDGLRRLVRIQVENRIHGLAPLGVTGESPALTDAEVARLVEIVVNEAGGRCRLAPDTCSCNLEQTISRVRLYAELGCDYAVVFAPFLVMPTQEGLVDFYRRVADVSRIPVIVHNAPERVGVNVEPKTYGKLIGHGNIIATKDGNKQLDHLAKILYLAKGSTFSVFTGKDTTCFPLMSFGGSGVFTVAGNIVPAVMRDLVDLVLQGKTEQARQLHFEYYELFEALRLETNPMAVKEALALLGLPGGPLRPPLTKLTEANRELLRKLLKEKDLL
ncbi:MAG: 4-hydroxy-tetrahydrodipicolinate synthase [Candidatus Aminicenantes bacterium RBG_19FT_COMBO_65_30]|nr:MAG: 4-hydroxy-tetrahydrodipicolinate synthase [Candidatus Aminicenantes bacterium RBG_19FT_COMBO_65_30]